MQEGLPMRKVYKSELLSLRFGYERFDDFWKAKTRLSVRTYVARRVATVGRDDDGNIA